MEDESAILDTNILVYAYDTFDKRKHEKCKPLVEAAFKGDGRFAVSNQILSELFFVLTQKLKKPFSLEDAEAIVSGIIDSANWIKINYDHETVKKAIAIAKSSKMPIWDSLIIATALENGITKIYTENTKDFKEIARIDAINPIN
ncbi:MAG: PIN domain-containing protein [Candidatus Aenigmarchaeota archaeon]|nr:PIN domain-containing protein [Candidatus Aenigmarchaeota archaeon]